MAELNDKARSLIDGPNLAFLAEVMEDGSPHVSPVWIDLEDGYLTFNTASEAESSRSSRAWWPMIRSTRSPRSTSVRTPTPGGDPTRSA